MKSKATRPTAKSHFTKHQTETLFSDTEKMLYKLAWSATAASGLPYDECLSECFYAFVKAVNWRFDPNKGVKFSTQVCTIATWRLKSLARRRNLALPMEELNEETAGFAPEQRSACLEVIETLSQDAREIISLLLETPEELMEGVTSPARLLSRVKEYLREQGRSKEDLSCAHEEIQLAFRAVWANN